MYYSLVHFPKIENKDFHKFRNKYDPFVELLPTHIAFIFPVPDSLRLNNRSCHRLTNCITHSFIQKQSEIQQVTAPKIQFCFEVKEFSQNFLPACHCSSKSTESSKIQNQQV